MGGRAFYLKAESARPMLAENAWKFFRRICGIAPVPFGENEAEPPPIGTTTLEIHVLVPARSVVVASYILYLQHNFSLG